MLKEDLEELCLVGVRDSWVPQATGGAAVVAMIAACASGPAQTSENRINPDAIGNPNAASAVFANTFHDFVKKMIPVQLVLGKITVNQRVLEARSGSNQQIDGVDVKPYGEFGTYMKVIAGAGGDWHAFYAAQAEGWGIDPDGVSTAIAAGVESGGEEIVANAENGTLLIKGVPDMPNGVYSISPSGEAKQLTTEISSLAGKEALKILSQALSNNETPQA